VSQGSNVSFSFTPEAGYRVADVVVDGVSVGSLASYTFFNVTAGHSISVAFAAEVVPPPSTFTVTPTSGANGSISPGTPQTVISGGSLTFAIAANPGYHIADVLKDGVSIGASSSVTFSNVTANHTLSATFAINTYSIVPIAGMNGTISPSATQTVNHGSSSATFTITPAPGYHVANVLVDGISLGAVTSYKFTDVTANHTIAATFGWTKLPTTTALKANAKVLNSGQYVTLNSVLRGGKFPPGTTIRFEVKKPGSMTYTLLKTVKVSPNGTASYRYKVVARGTRYHRVRFLGDATYLPAPIQKGIPLRVR
jgi:hypothetical protein